MSHKRHILRFSGKDNYFYVNIKGITPLFDKTEWNNALFFDKTEWNNILIFDKNEWKNMFKNDKFFFALSSFISIFA